MEKNIEFYRECLKTELRKPFNQVDYMYMRHLDNKINELKKLNCLDAYIDNDHIINE